MATEPGPGLPDRISVYDVILVMTDQMAEIAWQKLGLRPGLTGRLERDLPEAKVAVDVAAGLAAFLEPKLDDEDRRRIHNLVRDLRLNYVQQAGGAGGEGGVA